MSKKKSSHITKNGVTWRYEKRKVQMTEFVHESVRARMPKDWEPDTRDVEMHIVWPDFKFAVPHSASLEKFGGRAHFASESAARAAMLDWANRDWRKAA